MAQYHFCPFGGNCSYYHGEHEKRNLIDPIPQLAEGVCLPPMPEKLRNSHKEGRYKYNYNTDFNNWQLETNPADRKNNN